MRKRLRLEPVRKGGRAGYPTRDTVDANPEVLRRLPARWVGMPLVMSLAGAAGLAWMQASYNPVHAAECSGVPPLVQLPELDARRIIADEAAKAALDFSGPGREVKGVVLAPVAEGTPGYTTTITLDGSDTRRKISYAYISPNVDVPAMNKQTPGAGHAIACQDSDTLAEEMRGKAGQPVGIFLSNEAYSQEDAEEQLRQQVRDFVTWLKAQGVI